MKTKQLCGLFPQCGLKEIGSHRFDEIHLEKGHLPLITKVKHEKYGDWMKPVVDGWYINTQSDTNEKYMQLFAIKKQLNLDIKVEIGRDFETQSSKTGKTRTKNNDTLRVIIGNEIDVTTEPYFVYFGVLQKIGFEAIRKKNISIQGQKLVTLTNQYGSIQVQTNDSLWITMPPRESLVIKWLNIVTSIMGFEITLIDVIHNKKFIFPKKDITTAIKQTNKPIRTQRRSTLLRDNTMPSTPNPEIERQEEKTSETISRKKLELKINDTVFHVGDIVTHKTWGDGIVKEISLDGSLLGVKFHDINLTYLKPNTLEITEKIETRKHIIEQKKKRSVKAIRNKELDRKSDGIVFREGDMVSHKIWGNGIVKEIILNGALIGVKFQNGNVTYVKPNTLELTETLGTKKSKKKDFERIIPFKEGKYSSVKLASNAQLIRRLMRTGGLSLGGMIYSPKYGTGIISHMDSSCIKASFNNVLETLYILIPAGVNYNPLII